MRQSCCRTLHNTAYGILCIDSFLQPLFQVGFAAYFGYTCLYGNTGSNFFAITPAATRHSVSRPLKCPPPR